MKKSFDPSLGLGKKLGMTLAALVLAGFAAGPVYADAAPATAPPADPAIAAVDAPHEEVAEKELSPAEQLTLARKLEREAASHRRIAARTLRKQAADLRRVAARDRSKAARNARLARNYQRLAQRSLRRGA